MIKKKLSILLSLALVLQLLGAVSVSASTTKSSDISGHWAEQTIQSWLDQGIVSGYKDGSFKPNAFISRAEFIKMMNRVFEVPAAKSAVSFSDLTEQHWAYAGISSAVEAGYVSGTSATTVSPNANITRQEAAVMLVKLAKLEGTADLNFKDAAEIPQWSRKAIATLVAGEFMQGDPSGNVRAKDPLKRAEAVVLIDKVAQSLETVFDQQGEYGSNDQATIINGDVRITASNVTLINTEITGNLIIDKAVGEGDVHLKKVVVKGTTFVQGGGENSVHLEDTVVLRIVVDKASGKVRIVAQGATSVQQVVVQSPVKLEESQVTDTGFANVDLASNLPAGSQVDLIGHFESVQVMTSNIQVSIPSGSVNKLSVLEGAAGNTIALDQAASIETLVLDIVTKIIGQGTIQQAQVSSLAQSSSFETEPKQLTVVEKGTPVTSPTPTPGVVSPSNPVPAPPVVPPVSPAPTEPTPTEPTPTEPTPTKPTPTEPVDNGDKSHDASIHNLTINDGLTLSKMGLPSSTTLPVKGFDPEYSSYTVDLPMDQDKITVTLQLEADENAKIETAGRENKVSGDYFELIEENRTYTFELLTEKSYYVSLFIESESGNYRKYYDIYFIGELNLQQDFQIITNKGEHALRTGSLKNGDEVIVTIPKNHSKTGESVQYSLTESNGYALGSYGGYLSVALPDFRPTSDIGVIELMIKRDGHILSEGDYTFDFTFIQIDTLPFQFVDIEYKTRDEVNQHNNNNSVKIAYEYVTHLLKKEIVEFYRNAAYVHFDHQIKDYNYVSEKTTNHENLKAYRTVYGPSFDELNTHYPYSHYIPVGTQGQYEALTGQSIVLIIYDSQLNVIAVLRDEFDIPEENLADNVVPRIVITEEELRDVPLVLNSSISSSIDWKKKHRHGIPIENVKDAEFAPDYYTYQGTYKNTYSDQELKLEFDVAPGLRIDVSVLESDAHSGERITSYVYNNLKAGSEKTMLLNGAVDYYLNVMVTNPYTMESNRYSFELKAERDIHEQFYLSEEMFYGKFLRTGDELEVIIPAENSATGQEHTFRYKVGAQTDLPVGMYIDQEHFNIFKRLDPITGQYVGFEPNQAIGSLGIRLTRDGELIYDGSYSYMFEGLEPIITTNVVNFYNETERQQYSDSIGLNYDLVAKFDFSSVDGAAYVANYDVAFLLDNQMPYIGVSPTYQSASSRQDLTQLNEDGTTILSLLFSDTELAGHMFVSYIVYDKNRVPIGYVVFEKPMEQGFVSERITIIK